MEIVFFILACFLILFVFSVASRPWEDWETGMPDKHWHDSSKPDNSGIDASSKGNKPVQASRHDNQNDENRWPFLRERRVPIPISTEDEQDRTADC